MKLLIIPLHELSVINTARLNLSYYNVPYEISNNDWIMFGYSNCSWGLFGDALENM